MSFRLPGIRANDVGFILAAHQVYVRAGGHCLAGPDADAIRISTHVYNAVAEVDRTADLLAHIAQESR